MKERKISKKLEFGFFQILDRAIAENLNPLKMLRRSPFEKGMSIFERLDWINEKKKIKIFFQ